MDLPSKLGDAFLTFLFEKFWGWVVPLVIALITRIPGVRAKLGMAATPVLFFFLGVAAILGLAAITGFLKRPATPVDLSTASHFRDKQIPISALAGVTGKIFEGCEFTGPAVVSFQTVVLKESIFNDITRIIVPDDKQPDSGVVFINACTFERCVFNRITLIGTQRAIDHILKQIMHIGEPR